MRFAMGEINVFCTSRERSVSFYVGVLGFQVEEEEGGAIRLRNGNRRLLLLPFAGGPLEIHPYGSQPTISFDLPVEAIARAIGLPPNNLCRACINGQYPTDAGQQLYQVAVKNFERNTETRRTYEEDVLPVT